MQEKVTLLVKVGNFVIKKDAVNFNGTWTARGKGNLGVTLQLAWTDLSVKVIVTLDGQQYEVDLGIVSGRRTYRMGGHFTLRNGLDLVISRNSRVIIEHNPVTQSDWVILQFQARIAPSLPELTIMSAQTVGDDDIFTQTEQQQQQQRQKKRQRQKKQQIVVSSDEFDDEFSN